MVGDDVKLTLFHWNKTENPEKYWFLCEAVWTVKQVFDEDIRKDQLEITFQGCALYWYMKFMQVSTSNQHKTLAETRTELNEEFQQPKYESQYITEIKEIKQYPNESVWDLNQ